MNPDHEAECALNRSHDREIQVFKSRKETFIECRPDPSKLVKGPILFRFLAL